MKLPLLKPLLKWGQVSVLWVLQLLGGFAAVLALSLVFRLIWEFLKLGWHLWDLIVKYLH